MKECWGNNFIKYFINYFLFKSFIKYFFTLNSNCNGIFNNLIYVIYNNNTSTNRTSNLTIHGSDR